MAVASAESRARRGRPCCCWNCAPTFFNVVSPDAAARACRSNQHRHGFVVWAGRGGWRVKSSSAACSLHGAGAVVAVAVSIIVGCRHGGHSARFMVRRIAFSSCGPSLRGKSSLLVVWAVLFGQSRITFSFLLYILHVDTSDGVTLKHVLGNRTIVEDAILPRPCSHPSLQPAPAPVRLVGLAIDEELWRLLWGRPPQLWVQISKKKKPT